MKLTEHDKVQLGHTSRRDKDKRTYPVVTKEMAQAAGMRPGTVRARLRKEGLTLEEALTRPLITKQEMGTTVSSYMRAKRVLES